MALLFGLIASAFHGLACASGPARQDGALAVLEVENRSMDELRVSVRGRVEGVVESGRRLRVRHLVPGTARISASGQGAGAFRADTELQLVAGGRALWTITPDLGREPLPEVAPLGGLTLENPERGAIAVTLTSEGRVVGTGRVFGGTTRTFEDLPSGRIAIEAQPEPAGAVVRDEVIVFPDESDTRATWRYRTSGARLVVINATDEALELAVDGQKRGRVPAGETVELVEGPGLRVVSAQSVPSLRPYETVLELSAEAPSSWEVTAGQAGLVIENETGEALTVTVREGARPAAAPLLEDVPLGAKDRIALQGVPTGIHEVRCVGARSGLVYAGRIEVFAGQTGTFVAGRVMGTVRVDNRTHAPISVYLSEGSGPERHVGEVARGQVALIRDLTRGAVTLRALHNPTSVGRLATGSAPVTPLTATELHGAAAARLFSTRLDLTESATATWIVTERVGSVGIRNLRDEALEVYVDADRLGEVPARGEKVFTGVPAGARRVEVVGRRSAEVTSFSAVIGEDALVRFDIEDITAFFAIENQTGEALLPRGLMASQSERIEPGETVTFRVRAGEVQAVLSGAKSGFSYGKRETIAPGETGTWRVTVTPGRLIVWSRLAESVAVTLGDLAVGTLAPDETLVLPELLPGPVRVQTVGLRSGRIKAYDVVVPPGGDRRVTLSVELGVVLVENLAKEPVEVRIDGDLYGIVQGARVHAFGRVPPGPREVTFDFVRSRRTQRVALDLREGQRARVVAHPPQGLVVVDNGSREDLRVRVDEQTVARIPRDAGPALVTVPAGARHIKIERMSSRTQVGFSIEVFADQAIHLPVPPTDVRLVVVNRTEGPLELFVGEMALMTIAAKSSEMVEGLPLGAARLFAKDPGSGAVTHEERRTLFAGETATWVLDAIR